MSIPEQAGKVATSAIDALKTSPALLAVILLQLATLGVLAYVNENQNARRQERELLLLRSCLASIHEQDRR